MMQCTGMSFAPNLILYLVVVGGHIYHKVKIVQSKIIKNERERESRRRFNWTLPTVTTMMPPSCFSVFCTCPLHALVIEDLALYYDSMASE